MHALNGMGLRCHAELGYVSGRLPAMNTRGATYLAHWPSRDTSQPRACWQLEAIRR
jgi:hypothetical protein